MASETKQNLKAAPAEESTPPPPSRWRSNWALRGYLSTFGQSLQMVSSLKTTSGSASDRHALFGFAAVNLLANAINILFGAQHKDDPNHLRYLKEQINAELAPLKREDAALPEADQTLTQTVQDKSLVGYLRKYSVTISEFVLRTVGSLSLIAPITGWGKAARNLRSGMALGEVFQLARNKNPVTFGGGLFSLAGKGFVLAAKEVDPYSPEPHTLWRSLRENVMFRASSLSEGFCAAWMSHDRFTKQKITINGVSKPDYYGGYGNAAFVAGYVPRWFSSYGTREVNMPELYAHIATALHALPDDKIESAKQRIVSEMAEHFKDKHLSAASIRQEIDQRMKPMAPSVHAAKPSPQVRIDTDVTRDGRIDPQAKQVG